MHQRLSVCIAVLTGGGVRGMNEPPHGRFVYNISEEDTAGVLSNTKVVTGCNVFSN